MRYGKNPTGFRDPYAVRMRCIGMKGKIMRTLKPAFYRLIDGVGNRVKDRNDAILEASSLDSSTSIVICEFKDGNELTISQHECGEWCLAFNSDPIEDYDLDSKSEAIVRWCEVVDDHCQQFLR